MIIELDQEQLAIIEISLNNRLQYLQKRKKEVEKNYKSDINAEIYKTKRTLDKIKKKNNKYSTISK